MPSWTRCRPACWCRCVRRRRRRGPSAALRRGSSRRWLSACSVTAGSLPASRPPARVLGSSPMKRLFSRAPLLGVVIPAWGVEDYLDDCVRSLARPDAPALGGGDRRRRRDRPHRRDRRRVGAPRQPHQRRPLRQRRPRRRPQPRRPARARRLPRLPRLRRRAAAHGVRRPGGRARRLGLRLRHRLDRALGGRPAWSSRRGCGASTGPCGVRASRTGPRCSATSSRGTRCSAGRGGTRAGLSWPEGVRYEDQPTTTRAFLDGQVRRARRGRLPLADPRGLDHPDPGVVAAGPRRPLGDQADSRSPRCAPTGRPRSRRSSSTGCWPATSGATSCWCPGARPSGGGCCDRACSSCGADARSCTAACRRSTGSPAGWSQQDRRADVTALMEWVATLDGPAPRVQDIATGAWRLSVPPSVLDETTVDPAALALRDHELRRWSRRSRSDRHEARGCDRTRLLDQRCLAARSGLRSSRNSLATSAGLLAVDLDADEQLSEGLVVERRHQRR